ncbi:MAG: SEL1-like repeat protein [Verrucomicrobia bacterium]|nr:SEL1-like repeat protein [Verrucomicrobiota bacterium]MBI3868806.1 SEL1-like repeat protein [Verrucomicrobiota bacterium]
MRNSVLRLLRLLVALRILTLAGLCHCQAAESLDELNAKAEKGDAAAQFILGFMHEKGQGVTRDEAEAVKWYRKAADQGLANAQFNLGVMRANGRGATQDEAEAVKWYRKAADQDHASGQFNLGMMYANGQGVTKNEAEAVKWYRKAADQGLADAQSNLGFMYQKGQGVAKDEAEAVKWYRKAADQGLPNAQFNLGGMYTDGRGVPKDELQAYMWFLLAGAAGREDARAQISRIEQTLTPSQRAEGQRLAGLFQARKSSPSESPIPREAIAQSRPESTATGFFITDDGYFITNEHVAGDRANVRILTGAGAVSAKVVKVDKLNDLSLLKVDGKFAALPVSSSRGVRLGASVATVGFPNVGLQGYSPKLAKGEIGGLSGALDDARHFQISAPIQPGNSGGALVDELGNVIGIVASKLNPKAALATSGALAENVSYAVKSSFLLGFLESVPEIAARLKDPNTERRKFEDVVNSVEQATALVLVY